MCSKVKYEYNRHLKSVNCTFEIEISIIESFYDILEDVGKVRLGKCFVT